MKNTLFSILTLSYFGLSFGQINPVQNLEWGHSYIDMQNVFELSWEEPEQPHDELIGYNIYREEELYRFQTETSLGCNPNFGATEDCDFIMYYSDGAPFTGFVAAVYEGGIESEYISFDMTGVMLNSNEQNRVGFNIYPNPVFDELHFSEKLIEIQVSDLNGKIIFTKQEATSSLNFHSLHPGIFLLKAQTISGKLIIKTFIKK